MVGSGNAIDMAHVTFSYGDGEEPVLDDCSWSVPYGSLVLLKGESGCGKSTLLACLCGLAQSFPRSRFGGDIVVDGIDIRNRPVRDIARHIGVVQQDVDAQILHATVEDEIAFGCENLDMPPDRISREISRYCPALGIDPQGNTLTLSGGQKERVCCAAAFAMRRPVIALDEPLANLDQTGVEIVMRAVRRLADQGHAVIVCEHRISNVIRYADRIATVENGRIRETSTPSGRKGLPGGTRSSERSGPSRGTSRSARENSGAFPNRVTCGAGEPHPPSREPKSSVPMSLRDVVVRRQHRCIIHVDRLDIYRDQSVLVLGDNGCGKSTLLSLLSGVVRPGSGRVVDARGHRIGRGRGIRRAHLWQTPDYQIFTTTVLDELLARNADRSACLDMLDAIGLGGLSHRHPLSLSDGQKRRLVLAACLISEPDLLIVDEPSAGQDGPNLEREMNLIEERCVGRSCACVLATHDSRGAARYADRVLIMSEGAVVDDGGPELADKWFARFDVE